MRNPLPLIFATLCLAMLSGRASALVIDPRPEVGEPEAVVREFLRCVPGQKVNDLRQMLADTKTCHITQETDPARPGIWVEPWEAWLTWLVSMDQSAHIIEKIATTKVSDDLATVTLAGHTGDHRTDFRAVVVLTRKQGGQWKIISWAQENAVPAEAK